MARVNAKHGFGRLALCRALGRRLDPVIDGVGDQVGDGRFQPVEDVAIDARRFSQNFKPHLLAQFASGVANQAGHALNPFRERTQPAREHRSIETLNCDLIAAR